jgi:hypothetical protein
MELVFYTRPGCTLCDKALAVVRQSGFLRHHTLRLVDILGDAEAYDLYQWEIPVLVLDGREILKGIVTPERFTAKMRELEISL